MAIKAQSPFTRSSPPSLEPIQASGPLELFEYRVEPRLLDTRSLLRIAAQHTLLESRFARDSVSSCAWCAQWG